MKRLYLLRHAKSSWNEPGLSDFERPLKRRGREACAVIAAYMARERIAPELVLCSPAWRAAETLELVSSALGRALETSYRDGLYMATAARLLAEVRGVDDAVGALMVVGHNPGLADLMRGLAGSGDGRALAGLGRKVPTAALASLELACEGWAQAAPGGAHLAAYATPKGLA
ncbi:MAG: histidine phosphatase family protein [Alphaproteobacteria bacterium]|nr:histidine phosphatase family protein [Alphaproteobacteria bacterium]